MCRAFFLAIGIFLMILGVECLGVEKVTLRIHEDPPPTIWQQDNWSRVGPPKEITPPRWAPWSLLASGAVVCLYSFTIPRRVQGN